MKQGSKRNILAAAGLLFLAPLIAEFLLGIMPLKMLPALIVLAPMYGGGALLIRETVRRTGRGWISILMLALAYGLIEEGFATQSLFNPNYLSIGMHLLDAAYVPLFGIGGRWTVYVLTLHVAWSIATPIALMEGLFPDRTKTPWLGHAGLAVTALLFCIGVAGVTAISYRKDHFIASPMQFLSTVLLCLVLIILAFRLSRSRPARLNGWVPGPWLAGAIALMAASALLLTPYTWIWRGVAAILALDFGMCGVVTFWSRQTRWTQKQQLALAAGAALAYAWHSFLQTSIAGSSLFIVRLGHAIFALGAIVVIVLAAVRTTAHQEQLTLACD